MDVSFVIVSYNVCDLLRNCINSVSTASQAFNSEIIVVDNASNDNTVAEISQEFPEVRLIANTENIGFALANNQGIGLARGEYIFILNPDTIMMNDALWKMMAYIQENPEIGMLGPLLLNPDQSLQPVCARRLPSLASALVCDSLRLCKIGWISRHINYPYNYEESQEVEAISGAAMLVRSQIIRKLNGFGQAFIHGGEDVDLCFRFRKTGWRIYYLSDARIIHYKGRSSRQALVRIAINIIISHQEYFRRCYGHRHAILYRFIIQFIYAPILVLTGLLRIYKPSFRKDFQNILNISRTIYRWQPIR